MKKIIFILTLFFAIGSFSQGIDDADDDDFTDVYKIIERDKKFGVENDKGELVIKPIYNLILKAGNYFIVSKDNKEGLIDYEGNIKLSLEYEKVKLNSFNKDLFIVVKDGKRSLINLNETIYYSEYKKELPLSKKGFYAAKNINDKWGLIDSDSQIKIPFKYDFIYFDYGTNLYFNDGFVVVNKKNKKGTIDTAFNEIIPCEYDFIYKMNDSMFRVENDKKKGIIDFNNRILLPISYYGFYPPNYYKGWYNTGDKNFIVYDKKFKRGLANKKGNVLETIYDRIYDFEDGMGRVDKDDKTGFVDSSGTFVIPIDKYSEIKKYRNIHSFSTIFFSKGVAIAKKNKKWGLVNNKGIELTKFEYDDIEKFYYGKAIIKVGVKYGVINREGDILIECIYDMVRIKSNNSIRASKDDKEYIFNKSGKLISSKKIEINENEKFGIIITEEDK